MTRAASSRPILSGLLLVSLIWLGPAGQPRAETIPDPASAAATNEDIGQTARELYRQKKYAEALEPAEQALSAAEQAHGASHQQVSDALNDLAKVYVALGRSSDASPLYERAIEIDRQVHGAESPAIGITLFALAETYADQSRFDVAEPQLKRAIAIFEKSPGANEAYLGMSLQSLANVYRFQGRYAEAHLLYERSITELEQDLGNNSVVLATALHNFADNYRFQEDYAAAEPLLRRSLAIYERALGGKDPLVAATLTNLADVLRGSHKPADALPLLQRALRIRETALPPNHPDAGQTLIALADVSISLGDTDQAIQHLNRATTLFRNGLGADHSYVAVAYHRLGQVYASRENWNEAVQAFEECASIIARRTLRDTASLGAAISGSAQSEALRVRIAFDDFLNAAHHQAAREAGNLAGVRIAASKSFSFAQWAQNSAAADALLQQSIRAAGPGTVPALMRERDELMAQWRAADRRVISFLSQPLDARDPAAESALRGELAAIDARVAGIDRTITVEFPDYAAKYAAWASPEPLTLDAAKSLLGDNEVLAFFLDAGDMYLWLVTKFDSRWLRIDPGSTNLDDRVAALRCGLDSAMWQDDEGEPCRELLGLAPGAGWEPGKPLPFDVSRAHDLYTVLFGGVEDLLQNAGGTWKNLLVVPSGPLTQLPPSVLVTAKPVPDATGHEALRHAKWLGTRQALTVLPSVASLKALRGVAHAPSALGRKPYIGFANPLLDGDPDRESDKGNAAVAQKKDNCANTTKVRELFKLRAVFASAGAALLGGETGVDALRHLTPIPQTADLVCDVGQALGSGEDDIFLGARATETAVKDLSTSGRLASYTIVNFATHGLVTGNMEGITEPGLVLTPPAAGSATDDGYLSASEVATLKLDADWVILSACNTAAGGAADADALAGLARAFFYAGSRSLIVSHWSVSENAAVKLVTRATETLRADPAIGRAEAFRRAMQSLATSGAEAESHPAIWAPFVIVGEGGR